MRLQALTQDELQKIHEASITVLQKTGAEFRKCPAALEILEEGGCTIERDRAFFTQEIVDECLNWLPKRDDVIFFIPSFGMREPLDLSKGRSHFGLVGNAYHHYDYATGTVRDCLEADKQDKALIIESLKNFEFDFCLQYYHSERSGNPLAISANTVSSREVLTRWVSERAARGGKGYPIAHPRYTEEETRLAILGNMILDGSTGRMEELMEKSDVSFVWCNPISPLQYHPDEAERIVQTARSHHRYRTIMISPEVMMGATGPVTLAGALVQLNAEILAGMCLAQLAQPGTQIIYGCVSAPMDLRNAEISQGNFETALLNAASVQLADRYGLPSRIAPGNTSARAAGVRSATENAVGLIMGAAAGGNIITTGLLDSTLMISYEHLVLVNELISQTKSVSGDVSTSADSLAVGVIQRAGHPSPDFLQDEHTLTNMTRDIYYSAYNGRVKESYDAWYEKAHQKVTAILAARSSDTPPPPDISSRLKAVISRIEENEDRLTSPDTDWWRYYLQDL